MRPRAPPHASRSSSFCRKKEKPRSGTRPLRALERSDAARAAWVRVEEGAHAVGVPWKPAREAQWGGERLSRECPQDALRGELLPVGGAQLTILPEPLDARLDPINLTRLAERGTAGHQVEEGAGVLRGGPTHLDLRPREQETLVRDLRVELEAPTRREALGPQRAGLVVGGLDRRRSGRKPGDRLRDGEALLGLRRPRTVCRPTLSEAQLERRVGQEACRLRLRRGARVERQRRLRGRVRLQDEPDVVVHPEPVVRVCFEGADKRCQREHLAAIRSNSHSVLLEAAGERRAPWS